jgi:hypothetical protein
MDCRNWQAGDQLPEVTESSPSGAGQLSRFSRKTKMETPVGLRRFSTVKPLQFQ